MAASINDYFNKTGTPGSATFLTAPGHTVAGTSFTVDSTSLWSTDTAVVFGIDTTSLVDGVYTRDAGTYTVWRGVVASGTTITDCVLMYGTDQNYPAGSTTRVYILPTTSRENRLVDGLLIEHAQTGLHTLTSGATITSSKIITGLNDTNGNELFKVNATGSAVNELTITNAATGTSPIISATGGDTNIGLTLTPKGSGNVEITKRSDGWVTGLTAPTSITASGNRSYSILHPASVATYKTPGFRNRYIRTITAPTQCADLESGSSQYFSKTTPAGLIFTTTFTVSAWVKLESYVASGIIARRNADTEGWSIIINASGQISISAYRIAGNNKVGLSSQSIPLNKWVHIAASMDVSVAGDASTLIYIDGVLVPSSVTTTGTCTALVQGTTALVVGAQKSAGTNPFDGKIAQAAVFSAVLSAATIRSYMSQTLSGSETSLVSAYSLSNSIVDLNANANDLTAQGSALATDLDTPFTQTQVGITAGTQNYSITTLISSDGLTETVQVAEGDTLPTSGGVSAMAYSTQDSPYGFPKSNGKWEIETTLISVNTSTSIGSANQWITTNGELYVPIGDWKVYYSVNIQLHSTVNGARDGSLGLYSATYNALVNADRKYRLISHIPYLNSSADSIGQQTSEAIFNMPTADTFYLMVDIRSASGTETFSMPYGSELGWIKAIPSYL